MSDQAAFADRAPPTRTEPIVRPRAGGDAALDRIARGLAYALPILFIVGRAPADAAISLVAAFFLARSALGGGWAWLKTPWVAAALVFWAHLLLASALAIAPADSFGRALPYIRFVLFAAALQHWLLIERKSIERLLASLALAVGFVLLDCLYQYAMGEDAFGKVAEGAFRLSGPFNNDVAGTFMAKTSLPLLGWFFAWTTGKGRVSWLAGGAIALLIGLVIMLTGERTALVSYFIGLFVLIVAIPEIRKPLLLLGLIGAVGLGAALAGQKQLHKRFIGHTTADFEDFWNNRYGIIFVRAFEAWRTDPLTGVGLKNFRLTCETGNFQHKGPVESWCFNHAHNPYLEILSETGAVGLLLFLLMVALILREFVAGWRRDRPDRALAIGASASLFLFLWPVMVSQSVFSNWNAMLFWLAIAIALAAATPRSSGPADVR